MEEFEDSLRAALAPSYQLVRALGAGGMGRVYLAREPALKRTVAVKVLATHLALLPDARTRFEREAQAVAALSHPNVVAVHAVGELPDRTPYFVMQHVGGHSMAERLANEGPLPVPEARRIIGEVAAALAAAHARGIIHRDIKPANILYDQEAGRALVSDFGIAAVTARAAAGRTSGPDGGAAEPDDEEAWRLTQTGALMGTPRYMSPEQVLSEPATDKTDVYGLGLLGYELLAGTGPFAATTPKEQMAAQLGDSPRRLLEVRKEVDVELDALISRCLEKRPDRRPTAAEVSRRLAPGGSTLLEWPPPGLETADGGLARVTRWYWAGTALMLAAALPLLEGARLDAAGPILGPSVLLLAGVVGLALLTRAAHLTIRLGAAVTRAAHGGFAWLTILEALADPRGDTGRLIAGTGDFGGISTGLRSRLRRLRVARAVCLAMGGALPLPILLLVLVSASRGPGIAALAWVTLAPPLLALLIEARVRAFERRVAPPSDRKTHRGSGPDLALLSNAWYEGFESVRQGQSLGRGPTGPATAGRTAAWTSVALALLAGVIVAPLIALGAVGPSVWQRVATAVGESQAKADFAEPMRAFGIAKDSSITPLDAGRAFAAMRGALPEGDLPSVPQPPRMPAPWSGHLPSGLFPDAPPRAVTGLPDHLTILEVVGRAFSPAEMAYLEQIAHDSVWLQVSSVARAPAVDYLGGQFRIPFPPTVTFSLTSPRLSKTRVVAYAAGARAAWLLARGERDSAESALRELVSFGFALMDNGNGPFDALWGATIVGTGRGNLLQVYTITHHPLAARLRALTDSAQTLADERAATRDAAGRRGSSDTERRREAIAVAGDARYLRGTRAEMLRTLGLTPCTNLRELIFGPDSDVTNAFVAARQDFARFPSEQSMLDVLATGAERARYLPLPESLVGQAIGVTSDLLGALLRNPRIPGCARLAWYLETVEPKEWYEIG